MHTFPLKLYFYRQPKTRYVQRPSAAVVLIFLARGTFVLHPLAARYLAERLLEFSVALAGRIALLGNGLQRRQGVGLVLLPGSLPGLRARDAADGALENAGTG